MCSPKEREAHFKRFEQISANTEFHKSGVLISLGRRPREMLINIATTAKG